MRTPPVTPPWLRPFDELRAAVSSDRTWEQVLGPPGRQLPACGVHLAVFVAPYLGYVLDGSKTVESRFSVNRCAPFGKVRAGDVLLLKRTGGPVVGLARARAVWSYHLDTATWREIRERFATALRAQDPTFWEQRRSAAYATLLLLGDVLEVTPVQWAKRDRRGWVVLHDGGGW